MSLVVREEQVAAFKGGELAGNELLAMMAYAIVSRCQQGACTAGELSALILPRFPLVEMAFTTKAFEMALDVVVDARFVAYCPSTGKYRGTLAGRLIDTIMDDLAGASGKVAVVKFIHWAEHPEEAEVAVNEYQHTQQEKLAQVKAQLKELIEKETIQ
jgi:hypothetical protein